MEHLIIETIAAADNETQKEIFARLAESGLNENDVDVIRKMVFFHKLYTDKDFYNSVVETLGNNLYNHFNN